jgi:small-conductance mechanosensitive channel
MMNQTTQNSVNSTRITMASRSTFLSMLLLLLLCMCGVSLHAEAADKKAGREREALHRMQQQLAQVQGQIATLEQEKAQLTDDLEKSQAASKAAAGQSASLQREVKAGKQQQASKAKELALAKEESGTTAQQLADTRKKLDETARALQQATADKSNLEAIKSRHEREISACESKNLALYKVGRSLMERFEHKTCGETLAQSDPFTGVKKVETENLLEEYRDKLDEQKLVKPPGG